MFSRFFRLGLIFCAVLILYYPFFSIYFSQDDFFQFKASLTDGSLGQFVNLFGFTSFEERGYAFYRPVFREGLHNIYYSLFGLNAYPMHIFSFLIHFANITLVYLLILKLLKNKGVAFLTAMFFGISTPNVAVLSYLAGGMEVSGATMFILLSVISFSKYLDENNLKYKLFSFVAYLLALGSHELSIITPFLLAGLIFVKEKFAVFLKSTVRELWFSFALLLGYLYLDVVKIGFLQKEEQYQTVFSAKRTLNTFSWYVVWALGLPEMLIDFVNPGLKLNPSLMRHWGNFYRVIFLLFFIAVGVIGLMGAYFVVLKRKLLEDKKLLFLLFWFPLAVSPIVFLPMHKSTHYLVPALPAFWGILWYLTFKFYSTNKNAFAKWVLIVLGMSTGVLSIYGAKLGDQTYWSASRGRLAEKLIEDVKDAHPVLPKGGIVYFANDPYYPFVAKEWGSTSRQAAFILNNEDALQLYFKDPTLRVFYEDLGGVPDTYTNDNIYDIVAKITP